jgi:hypothetical protein
MSGSIGAGALTVVSRGAAAGSALRINCVTPFLRIAFAQSARHVRRHGGKRPGGLGAPVTVRMFDKAES